MVTKDFEYKRAANLLQGNTSNIGYAKEKTYKKNIFYIIEGINEVFVNFLNLELRFEKYKLTFFSKFLLYKYLKLSCAKQNQTNNAASALIFELFPVIKSTFGTEIVGSRYTFKNQNYTIAIICLTFYQISLQTNITFLYCLDTSCGVILIDCVQFLKKVLIEKILKMAILLKVRGIRSLKHKLDKFVFISLYFSGINSKNRPVYAHIYQKLYLIKGLKANLLVNNNILVIKRVVINIANKTALILSCQVIISVTPWLKS